MLYTADFETTTKLDDCRVWAWGTCEIGNPKNFKYGTTIDEFMVTQCADPLINNVYFFHNLKFDGEFIIYWLFRNGFTHVGSRKELRNKTFTTLISDKGQFYSLEVCFKKQGKKINKVTFYDSLKKLNFRVEKIAKDFDLPIRKGEIDYKAERPFGHILTDEEVAYLRNDVEIMSRALDTLFKNNMEKMTIGSDALAQYKEIVGKANFQKLFPIMDNETDDNIRKSYKGGWTYLSTKFKGKTVGDGIVLDVNSLYPWVMYTKDLPFGEPVKFMGKYKEDKLYPLYMQRITCMFELKKDHVPCIQIKKNLNFRGTEYLESSRNLMGVLMEVELNLTSVDLKLFLEHYDVYNPEYIDGYKFKSSSNLFKEYIDKWIKVKIESTENGNSSMRAIAKLMLNSLYGKFGLNPLVRSKIPSYVKGNDKLHYSYGEEEHRKPIYIPMASFITAYAREKTIRTAQSVYDRFIYADTDSLHLVGLNIPDEIEVNPTKLGAWDYEFKFSKAKFLRQKCYMERGKNPFKEGDEYTKITCAGMPDKCHENVNFDNFKIGGVFEGKLKTTRTNGGIVLEDTTFTIKENMFLGL